LTGEDAIDCLAALTFNDGRGFLKGCHLLEIHPNTRREINDRANQRDAAKTVHKGGEMARNESKRRIAKSRNLKKGRPHLLQSA
jgi:hypothetical protein